MSLARTTSYVAVYLTGTLMLSLAALYNGYPLVYWDSGSYLRALIEWHNLPDRPVFYSIFLGLLHRRISLWPVVFGQAALTVFVIERTLACMAPPFSVVRVLGILLILTVATSLPWFTGQIMPYFLTPLLVLSIYLISVERDRIARWEYIAFVVILLGAEACHYSHVALAMGLIGILGIISLAFRTFPIKNLIGPALATVMAAVAIYAVNYVDRREIVFGPRNSILLFDRLLEYGTAQRYLARECPVHHYEICPYLAQLERLPPRFGEFMWADDSIIHDVGGPEHYRHEADQLVHDILMDAPVEHLRLMLGATIRALGNFPTGDEFSSYTAGDQIYRMITKYFPRDSSTFLQSREQQGTLTFGAINAIDVPVGYAAMAAAVLLLAAAIRYQDDRLATFLTAVLAALVGNALICGGLSSGDAHYQSRMIPLVVLAALIGGLRLRTEWRPAIQTSRREERKA